MGISCDQIFMHLKGTQFVSSLKKKKWKKKNVFTTDLMFCTSKAYIPPDTTFALGTQCKQKRDKQHETDMPYSHIANVKYIPPARIGPCVGSAVLVLGPRCFASGPRGFLYTHMLVYPTQNGRIGVIPNASPQHKRV